MHIRECRDCRIWEQLSVVPESDWYVLRADCTRCGRSCGTLPCSPYLQRPLRTLEQAQKDATK